MIRRLLKPLRCCGRSNSRHIAWSNRVPGRIRCRDWRTTTTRSFGGRASMARQTCAARSRTAIASAVDSRVLPTGGKRFDSPQPAPPIGPLSIERQPPDDTHEPGAKPLAIAQLPEAPIRADHRVLRHVTAFPRWCRTLWATRNASRYDSTGRAPAPISRRRWAWECWWVSPSVPRGATASALQYPDGTSSSRTSSRGGSRCARAGHPPGRRPWRGR
jgi:hypothetical protein